MCPGTIRSNIIYTQQVVEIQKSDFYQDIYTIFKSDLINTMDHMRISGTEPSSVILSQTK